MSATEIFAAIGGGVIASLVTAWTTLRGKEFDTLQLGEIEFRKALLQRIEQLEKLAREDNERIREARGRGAHAAPREREFEARAMTGPGTSPAGRTRGGRARPALPAPVAKSLARLGRAARPARPA